MVAFGEVGEQATARGRWKKTRARRMFVALAGALSFGLVACGGDDKDAKDPSDVAEASDKSPGSGAASADAAPSGDDGDEAEQTSGIPTKCDRKEGDVCLPSRSFVKKLCQGDYRTLALSLFADGTPWTRAYLTHETDAWNASGGGSSKEKLALDEEVIVVYYRKANSNEDGIQVSGANGGYDAVRWDGMCVTLDASELRFDPPSSPRNAHLVWSTIEISTRDVLKKDDTVRDAYIARKKECKGATVGKVSAKCEKLDKELSAVIAAYVRQSGSALPTPKKLPE